MQPHPPLSKISKLTSNERKERLYRYRGIPPLLNERNPQTGSSIVRYASGADIDMLPILIILHFPFVEIYAPEVSPRVDQTSISPRVRTPGRNLGCGRRMT